MQSLGLDAAAQQKLNCGFLKGGEQAGGARVSCLFLSVCALCGNRPAATTPGQ